MENPRVFDSAEFLERLMDDEDMARMLLERFMEEIPLHMKELRTGIESADAEKVHIKAHNIKGAAANLGAYRLRAAATAAENSAVSENMLNMPELIDMIEVEFNELKKAIAAYLGSAG